MIYIKIPPPKNNRFRSEVQKSKSQVKSQLKSQKKHHQRINLDGVFL